MVPLWFVARDEELIGWTYAKSQKARNPRATRATLGIEDGVQYHELRGVMLECSVQLEREPAEVERYGLALFERYVGELGAEVQSGGEGPGAKRVGLRFVPTRLVSWDHQARRGTDGRAQGPDPLG